jgi:antitoxin component of MazEF toxin-antitoxin module
MPTQKLKNRNIRKLTTVGKASLSVTLPKDLVNELKWKDKQKVVVKRKGSSLIIRDWKR